MYVRHHGPLDNAHAKLDRAAEHLQRLENEVASFLGDYPPLVDGHYTAEMRDGVLGLAPHCQLKPLPHEIAVTAGDIVHNLRCILDNVAWQLSAAPTRSTQFPITDAPKVVSGAIELPDVAGGATPEARKLIASWQPWAPDGVLDRMHELRILRELSNHDKHRQLIAPLQMYDVDVNGPDAPKVGTVFTPSLRWVERKAGAAHLDLVPRDELPAAHALAYPYTYQLGTRIKVLDKSGNVTDTIDFAVVPLFEQLVAKIRDEFLPSFEPLIPERSTSMTVEEPIE